MRRDSTSNNNSSNNNINDLDYLVEAIKRSGIDIAPTYDEYIASAFYIAKKAGVNIDEVRLKRAEERQRQMEKEQKQRWGKCSNVQMFSGLTSSHVARVPYNIDCDDDAFANMPDDFEEPISESAEPFAPLPLILDDYHWPKPIDEILTLAETKQQRDALFLGIVDAIGSTLSPYVRSMYGHNKRRTAPVA